MLRWNHKMEEKKVFNEVCVAIVLNVYIFTFNHYFHKTLRWLLQLDKPYDHNVVFSFSSPR